MSNRKRSGSASNPKTPTKRAAPDNQKRLDLFFSPKNAAAKPSNDRRQELDDVTNQSPQQITFEDDDDLESEAISPQLTTNMDSADQVLEELPVYKTSMYTDQFHEMLTTVLDSERFLFTDSEIELLDQIQHLEGRWYRTCADEEAMTWRVYLDEALHLFVRLWMRKYGWIRLDKLNYRSHVRDVHQSTIILRDAGLVMDTVTDSSEALALLSLDELKSLADECGVQPDKGTKNVGHHSGVCFARTKPCFVAV